MSQYDNIELGNLIFGYSRGDFSIDREKYQDLFVEKLEEIDVDAYGHYEGPLEKYKNDRGGITTDVIEINPYWWGDDDNDFEIEKPNFFYKPTDLKISWYKYPMRDSYSNKPLEEININEMFDKIKAHIKLLEKIEGLKNDMGMDEISRDANNVKDADGPDF